MRYALRISAGNFEGKNKKYKPVFHLHSEDFSPELRDQLSDCLRTSKESLHDVIQEGVFKLFCARHKMIFYEHIEPEPLRWEFVRLEMTTEDKDDLKGVNNCRDDERQQDDDLARWSEKVFEKYENLHNTVLNNLPNLWNAFEFALSVKTILNIRDCTLPFAGIILGPPSSLKTVVIELFRGRQTLFTLIILAQNHLYHISLA